MINIIWVLGQESAPKKLPYKYPHPFRPIRWSTCGWIHLNHLWKSWYGSFSPFFLRNIPRLIRRIKMNFISALKFAQTKQKTWNWTPSDSSVCFVMISSSSTALSELLCFRLIVGKTLWDNGKSKDLHWLLSGNLHFTNCDKTFSWMSVQ